MRSLLVPIVCGALLVAGACSKKQPPETTAGGTVGQPPAAGQPADPHAGADPHSGLDPHAGMGMGMQTPGPTDGEAVPLKLTGVGSAAELQREKAKLTDEAARLDFERAFRLTFTTERSLRDYARAHDLLQPILQAHSDFPGAHRTLGYVVFSLDPTRMDDALRHYNRAVELEPDYGEAHYAIAFMHAAREDRSEGLQHYKKAMELGVPDERNIGENFYGDLLRAQ